jgi:hypothetical protein
VPGSIPRIIFKGFCKEDLFLPINAAEQKYQNLPQLFSRTFIIRLVIFFNLQPGKTSARSQNILDEDQALPAKCGDMGPYYCCFFDDHQLVH